MTADVKMTGPLFDGRADAALDRGIKAVRAHVAATGVTMTRAVFAGSIRAEHGRFLASIGTTGQSRMYTTRGGHRTYTLPVVVDGTTDTLVTTDLATYGPWLEGSGSRNDSTRFKGYHGFRRAGQELDRIAGNLANVAIAPYVREMS